MINKDFLLGFGSGKAAGGGGGGGDITVESLSVSENGTYTASSGKAYSPVTVDVQPDLQSKSVTITENGTTNITPDTGKDGLSSVTVTVSVSGGGGGGSAVFESGTYSPTADESTATITFSNAHTAPPDFYTIFDSTGDDVPSGGIVSVDFVNFNGLGANVSISGGVKYAIGYGQDYSTTMPAKYVTHPVSESKPTNYTYYDFWATNEKITPSLANASRFFKTGRTYRWVAVWMS